MIDLYFNSIRVDRQICRMEEISGGSLMFYLTDDGDGVRLMGIYRSSFHHSLAADVRTTVPSSYLPHLQISTPLVPHILHHGKI